MKHKVAGRIFGRERNQRKALIKTLLGSLIVKEKITTTEAKAKELKNHIDRLVNKAKKSRKDEARKISLIRQLRRELPLMAVTKLTSSFSDQFDSRESGYVRVLKLEARKSDGAKMAVIAFV